MGWYKTKYIEVIEEFLRWQRERLCEIIQPGRGLHSELRPEGEQDPGEGRGRQGLPARRSSSVWEGPEGRESLALKGREKVRVAGGHVGEQWGLARSIWAALAGGRHSYSRVLGI